MTTTRADKLLNRLVMAPQRKCRSLHHCVLCPEHITDGQAYRDAGLDARAHLACVRAALAAREQHTPNDEGRTSL